MVVDFNSTAGAKVVAPIKLAHIVLRTSQLEEMGDFYVTFLGGQYALKASNLYFITYDDEHHRIGLIGMPELQQNDRSRTGLEVSIERGNLVPKQVLTYPAHRLYICFDVRPPTRLPSAQSKRYQASLVHESRSNYKYLLQ